MIGRQLGTIATRARNHRGCFVFTKGTRYQQLLSVNEKLATRSTTLVDS